MDLLSGGLAFGGILSYLKLSAFINNGKMEIHNTNFRNIRSVIKRSKLALDNDPTGQGLVDGIIMDLGISSHQIDEATRGFAFSQIGPLDMRMNYKSLEDVASGSDRFSDRDSDRDNGSHSDSDGKGNR